MVPRQPRLPRETLATRWRRWLALWREGQLAPEGCFREPTKAPCRNRVTLNICQAQLVTEPNLKGPITNGHTSFPNPSPEASAAGRSGIRPSTPTLHEVWGSLCTTWPAPLGRADWSSGPPDPMAVNQSVDSSVWWGSQSDSLSGACARRPQRPQGGMKMSGYGKRSHRSGCGIRDLGAVTSPKRRGCRIIAGWK